MPSESPHISGFSLSDNVQCHSVQCQQQMKPLSQRSPHCAGLKHNCWK